MAKVIEGEILGPEGHEYNDKELSPKDFLLAVVHDERVPLSARIDAAKAVSVYEHPRLAQVNQEVRATIRIEGGLPALPGTNVIMPEVKADGELEVTTKPNGKGNGSG